MTETDVPEKKKPDTTHEDYLFELTEFLKDKSEAKRS